MPNYQTKSSLIETDTEKQVLAKKRSAFITEYIRSPDEHEKTDNLHADNFISFCTKFSFGSNKS